MLVSCTNTGPSLILLVGERSSNMLVSAGRICSDNCACCHTEIESADQTCYLTHSLYTDTGLTSHTVDLITPGIGQDVQWITNFSLIRSALPDRQLVTVNSFCSLCTSLVLFFLTFDNVFIVVPYFFCPGRSKNYIVTAVIGRKLSW